MTAGEGGAVLLPDADMYPDAFARHSCGRPIGDLHYRHVTPSSNFRLPEFSGAVLRAQLTRLRAQNEQREEQWKSLSSGLAEIPGVIPQGRDYRCELNPHYMAMFTLDRQLLAGITGDDVVEALKAEGIPALPNYPPVYRTQAFWAGPSTGLPSVEELAERCPNSEMLGTYGVWLHHRVLLGGDQEVADVAEAVAKVTGGLSAGQ